MKTTAIRISLAGVLAMVMVVVAESGAAAQCFPVPESLVGWWRGEGNAEDETGSHDGAEQGGLAYSSGKVGQAFSFDGIDDLVRVPDADALDLSSGNFTIELWVKPDSCSTGDAIPYVVKESPTQFDAYNVGLAVNSWFGGLTSNAYSTWDTLVLGGACVPGTWQHIVFARDTLYVDGAFVGTDTVSLPPGNTSLPLYFGYREDVSSTGGLQTRYFGGLLDEISIYGEVLSDAEIFAIFQAGSAGKCATADSDGDGVPDEEDICPGGDDTVDTDGDSVPDFCDACPYDAQNDADGDGVCGDVDVCEGGDDNLDADLDGTPDFCDVCPVDPFNDADDDGFCADADNCPEQWNPSQADTDEDGLGDECDPDDDDDGVEDGDDNCPFDFNPDQEDFDQDGAGDFCDSDDDGDGVQDDGDECPMTVPGDVVAGNGCSIAQICPCENDWKNHGAYVRCVAHTSEVFVELDLLTEEEKDATVSEAGASSCGHKN